jgi:hypothetical protein
MRCMCLSTMIYNLRKLTLFSSRKNQIHSPLLHLPAELRNLIFAYALGTSSIKRCDEYQYNCRVCKKTKGPGGTENYYKVVFWHFECCLGILPTCRQVYAESKVLPFKLNTVSSHIIDSSWLVYTNFAAWQCNAITAVEIHARSSHEHATSNYDIMFLLLQTRYLEGLERVTFVWHL